MGGQRALDALGLGGSYGHDFVDGPALDLGPLDYGRWDFGRGASGRRPIRDKFEVQAGGAVGRGDLLVIGDRLDEFLDVSRRRGLCAAGIEVRLSWRFDLGRFGCQRGFARRANGGCTEPMVSLGPGRSIRVHCGGGHAELCIAWGMGGFLRCVHDRCDRVWCDRDEGLEQVWPGWGPRSGPWCADEFCGSRRSDSLAGLRLEPFAALVARGACDEPFDHGDCRYGAL